MIITIEGLDQSGKETQAKLLKDKLSQIEGLNVEIISLPDYTTPIGTAITEMLFIKSDESRYNRVTHMLMSANRWELEPKISDANKGGVLILDRYKESNIAYGVANGLERKWLEDLDKNLPDSDMVFYIKTDPADTREREEIPDKFERDIEYLTKVGKVYNTLSIENRWHVIDGKETPERIHELILVELRKHFKIPP